MTSKVCEEITVSINEAATLEKAGVSTIYSRVTQEKYVTCTVPSSKQKGKTETRIYLSSLPKVAINRYVSQHRELMTEPTGDVVDMQTGEIISEAKKTSENQSAFYGSLSQKHREIVDRKLFTLNRYRKVLNNIAPHEGKTDAAAKLCDEEKITVATLYRWQKAFESEGLYGLRDKNFGQSRTKLSPPMIDYILGLIEEQPFRRIDHIMKFTNKKFGTEISYPTFRRFVTNWKEENHEIFTAVSDHDKWKNNYMVAHGDASEAATHFTHIFELDSSPADLLCADGKRYNLVSCLDVFSRKVKIIVSKTSNSFAIATILRASIIDWGIPEKTIIDNGQDYKSNHITAALASLAIDAPYVPAFSPEKKPHVERFFGTLSVGLFENLKGYIGHNVGERKKIESRKGFAARFMKERETIELSLMPEDLQNIINRWIEVVYHQRVHSTLKMSPEVKAAQTSSPVYKVQNERALDILLSPIAEATIGKKGIRYKNGHYLAAEFVTGWIGERVVIRNDMASAGTLYVFTMKGEYICTAYDKSLLNITPQEFGNLKKEQRRYVRDAVKNLRQLGKLVGDPMLDFLADDVASIKVASFVRKEAANTTALSQAERAATGAPGAKPAAHRTVLEIMQEREGSPVSETDIDADDPLAFMELLEA